MVKGVNQISFLDSYIEERSKKSEEFRNEYEKANQELQIAVLVKNLRTSSNLSQREFAKRIKKPQSTVARIENGTMSPTVGLLEDIAAFSNKKLKIEFAEM